MGATLRGVRQSASPRLGRALRQFFAGDVGVDAGLLDGGEDNLAVEAAVSGQLGFVEKIDIGVDGGEGLACVLHQRSEQVPLVARAMSLRMYDDPGVGQQVA